MGWEDLLENGKLYPNQYSGLQNSMYCIAAKRWTGLSDFHFHVLGFPGSSDGKESTCNVGDHGMIPGSGKSPGEGIGYPLQYSWASLVAQLVKNPSAMQVGLGLIPALGRSPEEGKDYPLQ